MKLFVTGGAGFIGSNLVRIALARGHRIHNFDKLTYAGNPASLADLADDPGYSFQKGDIAELAAVREALDAFQPEVFIHLAAETHVDRSIDDPGAFVRTNIDGTAALLEAVRGHLASGGGSLRFLHVSTDEVFGSLGPDGRFREGDPYAPRSPYAASKAASDHLVRAWSETYGLPALVAHASNTYGPRQFPEKLIPLVILKALRGEQIPIYGEGNQVRDWLHVSDLAHALLALAEKGKPGESYAIGGGNERTNLELVRQLCTTLDALHPAPGGEPHASRIRFVPDRPGHDFRYALDGAKARAELGWQPTTPLSEGLHATCDWYLKNQVWWRPILDGSYRLQRLGVG